MGAGYEIWICDDRGRRIRPLDSGLVSFEYVKAVNTIGWFNITHDNNLDPALLRPDAQIHIYRRPRFKDKMSLDFIGFLRFWQFSYQADTRLITMSGHDPNGLLDRRIIAYAAGSANAELSAVEADNGLKDIFNTNFIGGAVTGRDISSLSVTVQADATAGPAITKAFAWRKVFDVMLDIVEAARTAGTEVFFRLVPKSIAEDTGVVSFEFQTTTGQPGRDLTSGSGLPPVIFGSAFGNVTEAFLSYDYREERNYIYAGGQGEEDQRYIAESSDSSRINISAWNRIEYFADARNEETDAAVDDVADSALADRRPIVRLSATLQDTEQARYNIDWDLGDKVTIREFGEQYDGIIRAVTVFVNETGQESISVKVVDEGV